MKKDWKILTIIFLLAFVVRLAYGVYQYSTVGTSQFVDDWEYLAYANDILEHGLSNTDSNLFTQPDKVGPGFPTVIALLLHTFNNNIFSIIVANSIVSAFISLLIYKIASITFNDVIAFVSAIWSIFFIRFIYYVPWVLKEVWLVALLLLLIYIILKYERSTHQIGYMTLFTIFFSILIHFDERFFVYLPLFVIWILVFNHHDFKRGLNHCVILSILSLLLMAPWTFRNYDVYDRVIILTTRTSGFTDQILGYDDHISDESNRRLLDDPVFSTNVIDEITQGNGVYIQNSTGDTIAYLDSTSSLFRDIRHGILHGDIPRRFSLIESVVVETIEFWRPFRFHTGYVQNGFRWEKAWSFRHNFLNTLTYGLLLPFFLYGVLCVFAKRHKYGFIFLSIIALHTVLHIALTHCRNRYRLPIDPYIIIISIYGMYMLYRNYCHSRLCNKFMLTFIKLSSKVNCRMNAK